MQNLNDHYLTKRVCLLSTYGFDDCHARRKLWYPLGVQDATGSE